MHLCPVRSLTLLGLVLALVTTASPAMFAMPEGETQGNVSVLAPDTAPKTQYRFHVDAIDPSPESNPKGTDAPGYRGAQQLVIYTPAFGSHTGTNTFGTEAIVSQGTLQTMAPANSPIPASGFVVSGHGVAGQWMKRVLKPGAKVVLNPDTREIIVTMTPRVYLLEIDKTLAMAEKSASRQDPEFQQALSQARACANSLRAEADAPLTQGLYTQASACQAQANRAYYRSVPASASTYRGAWVRPVERSPEAIKKAIADLKAANIQHLYIETYYQGRTIYPSQVMAEYGLPRQHFAFEGWDPLKVWVDEAHAQGLKVHAWSQVFFAGSKHTSTEPFGPILQKYPAWANVQRTAVGKTQPVPSTVEDGHFFLDPANPEVRSFLQKLFVEIVTQYPMDGFNFDYIRYPASHPVTSSQYWLSTWGYTPTAREAFKMMLAKEREEAEAKRLEDLKKAGKPLPKVADKPKFSLPGDDPAVLTPKDPLWQRWVAWRKEQVSSFVNETQAQLRQKHPGIILSAVVFPQPDPQFELKCQDWPRWATSGWVDALTPIGLKDIYKDSLDFKRLTQGKIPVYVGIFGMYNRNTPVELVSQVDTVRQAGLPGIVLFERSRLDNTYRDALLESAFRIRPETTAER